jgi:hypothetical protein
MLRPEAEDLPERGRTAATPVVGIAGNVAEQH